MSDPPPGWGNDQLSSYMANAARNRWATFVHYPEIMARLSAIDSGFMALDGWRDPPNRVTPHLGFRSHASYRAACEHALGADASTDKEMRAMLKANRLAF